MRNPRPRKRPKRRRQPPRWPLLMTINVAGTEYRVELVDGLMFARSDAQYDGKPWSSPVFYNPAERLVRVSNRADRLDIERHFGELIYLLIERHAKPTKPAATDAA